MEILGGSWGTDMKFQADYHWWHTNRLIGLTIIAKRDNEYLRWTYTPDRVSTVQIVNTANQATVGRGVKGALIGTVIAGPVGLIAGAVIGSHKHRQMLVVTFNDGNQLMVSAKPKDTTFWLALGKLIA